MPIIEHRTAPEIPWRPAYRMWELAGAKDGMSSSLSLSVVGAGAGAPLHAHRDDELIVVLDGILEVRLGQEVHRVGADHTVAIPPDVPHSFTSVGEKAARVLIFFPVAYPFEGTTYLEGSPPQSLG